MLEAETIWFHGDYLRIVEGATFLRAEFGKGFCGRRRRRGMAGGCNNDSQTYDDKEMTARTGENTAGEVHDY
jgi:hypothetical protein